jgi:hypothetical protein
MKELLPRLLALLFCVGCSRTGELDVVFDLPETPDPFIGVDRLQVWGISNGERIRFGAYRWDQGPLELTSNIPPDVERLVFAGVADGTVLASGFSGGLDLVLAPPSRPIVVPFWSVGTVSRLAVRLDFEPAFAAALSGAVLFGGARPDDPPCAPWRTRWWSETGLRPGPEVPAARGPSVQALAAEGRLVVVAGDSACDGPDWAVVEATGEVRLPPDDLALAADAAYAVVTDRLVVGAGGTRDGRATADVVALDPAGVRGQFAGRLDGPRTDAAAAPVSGGRVAVVGGRSRTSTTTGLSDVSFFSVGAGSTQGVRLELAGGRRLPAMARLRSGSLIIVGGDAARRAELVVFPGARPDLVGLVEPFLSLATGREGGQLVDLDDGSLLWLSEDGEQFEWIQLLPAAVRSVPRPEGLVPPWVVTSAGPGRALIADRAGRLWSFNAGPQGTAAEAPTLAPPGPGLPLGYVPQTPAAWDLDADGVRGRSRIDFGVALLPDETLVLTRDRLTDFEVVLRYEVQGQARASFVFGIDEGDYDHVALFGTPRVIRAPVRSGVPVDCTPTISPELDQENVVHTVRIRRRGATVSMDVGDDGSTDLLCNAPSPRPGRLGLGLINGTVRWRSVAVLRP